MQHTASTTQDAVPGRYAAVQADQDGERRLGIVVLDDEGRITVEEADTQQQTTLEKIVRSMNGKSVLHVDVPPPPDAPRFALASRIVERGSPDFISALKEQLQRYYDVELRAQ